MQNFIGRKKYIFHLAWTRSFTTLWFAEKQKQTKKWTKKSTTKLLLQNTRLFTEATGKITTICYQYRAYNTTKEFCFQAEGGVPSTAIRKSLCSLGKNILNILNILFEAALVWGSGFAFSHLSFLFRNHIAEE